VSLCNDLLTKLHLRRKDCTNTSTGHNPFKTKFQKEKALYTEYSRIFSLSGVGGANGKIEYAADFDWGKAPADLQKFRDEPYPHFELMWKIVGDQHYTARHVETLGQRDARVDDGMDVDDEARPEEFEPVLSRSNKVPKPLLPPDQLISKDIQLSKKGQEMKQLLAESHKAFAAMFDSLSESSKLKAVYKRLLEISGTPDGHASSLNWNKAFDWVFKHSEGNSSSLVALFESLDDIKTPALIISFLERNVNVKD